MRKNKSKLRFSGEVRFFKSNTDFLKAKDNIHKRLSIPVRNWLDFETEFAQTLFSLPGLMPLLVKESPELSEVLMQFFFGNQRMLVFAGSPGNGKSLLLTEVRKQHEIISGLEEELTHPMSIITWDTVHSLFFETLSERINHKLSLPKGETHPLIRDIASNVMTELALWIYNLESQPKVLVETPITGNRGDKLLFMAGQYGINAKTLIMHSPEMEEEILNRGSRDVATSGQPAAMEEIKAKILKRMVGDYKVRNKRRADDIVKNYWEMLLLGRNGLVIEWTPNAERKMFEQTRKEFQKNSTKADEVSPIHLGQIIRRKYEDVFDMMDSEKLKVITEIAVG